jgi:CheY-like chemotaxis protein
MTPSKTCFLIDDDPDDQLIFAIALQNYNSSFICHTANNAFEALQRLEHGDFRPDYIFIDLNMPGMDGIECLSRVKSNEQLKKIPVIIFTTSSREKDIEETHALGAIAFIIKPYHVADLSKKLTDVFTLQQH